MSVDRTKMLEVLKIFGKAFNNNDADGILSCVTENFEWRLGEGPSAPDAKILVGAEEVRTELNTRAEKYKIIKFSETELIYSEKHVIGRFRATGEYANGRPLNVRGIDIYEFHNGKIAVKDSYWKYITE